MILQVAKYVNIKGELVKEAWVDMSNVGEEQFLNSSMERNWVEGQKGLILKSSSEVYDLEEIIIFSDPEILSH